MAEGLLPRERRAIELAQRQLAQRMLLPTMELRMAIVEDEAREIIRRRRRAFGELELP